MKQESVFKNFDVSEEGLNSRVHVLRGKRVMFDRDLAELYGVETKVLNRSVRRNIKRFPVDFMFQLEAGDVQNSLRYQFGTLNKSKNAPTEPNKILRCQNGTLKQGKHMKYLPYAFTEHGIAMLSSVLNSDRAIAVNIQIMRMFIRQREAVGASLEMKAKMSKLEQEQQENFKMVFEALGLLLKDRKKGMGIKAKKQKIGFAMK